VITTTTPAPAAELLEVPGYRPRLLLVGRERFQLPLPPHHERKFRALDARIDLRVMGAATARSSNSADPRFVLARPLALRPLDGLVFYVLLPVRVARQLRAFRPDAVLVQGVHEAIACLVGRAVAGSQARVILDVHGDWRGATRLYGSRLRGLLNPLNDWMGRVAVRRADAVRTVTPYTSGLVRALGVEPAATFPAYVDLESFAARPALPLPEHPQALFVGALERSKNVDGLVAAWRKAAARLPGAKLRVVGKGRLAPLVEALVRDLPGQAEWTRQLSTDGVAHALDDATALVLPSRTEGMGRVVVEAFWRGRGVIGSRVGGIADLVQDGVNGVLIEPGDVDALADVLVKVLSDSALAAELASGAQASSQGWLQSPELFAESVYSLVAGVAPAP
jgi:glycosyltransferase involved in cell wall biosynthesis